MVSVVTCLFFAMFGHVAGAEEELISVVTCLCLAMFGHVAGAEEELVSVVVTPIFVLLLLFFKWKGQNLH